MLIAVSLLHPHPARRVGDVRGARLDGREPAHALYEHACDLLLAARGLRAMAGAEGTLPAIAATLGCLEATVDALADTLEQLLRDEPDLAGRPDEPCAEIARTLRVARHMIAGLRERVGPALAEAAAS